jgi:predicted MPP superfamily phosphohydrolase
LSLSRRQFLTRAALAGVGVAVSGLAYTLLEAKWCRVLRVGLRLPNLPESFRGATVALLTDIHHGPYVPLAYVRHVVDTVNRLRPDAVCLGGDYVHRDRQYIAPCLRELGRLASRFGTYAVLGNHDHWEGVDEIRAKLAQHRIPDLTNRGLWLEDRGDRIRLCGVGDLWEDEQDLEAALGDARASDATLLLSHNPDYVEQIRDPRVGLVLSGHTHGGQVVLPFASAPFCPSLYGQKYLHGLVRTRTTQVFVSRGIGTITPPVRFRCRPEIVLIGLS